MTVHTTPYRRALLTLIGGFYLAIGAAHALGPSSRGLDTGFGWLPTHLDADELGWLWIIGGPIIVAAAWSGRSWSDKLAFGVATLLPALWASIFLISWLAYDNGTGARMALIYALLTAMLILIAAWPNPPRIKEAS